MAALGGDGFLTGAAELKTAVRLGLAGLLVVAYDDGEAGLAATVRSPADLAPLRAWLAGDRARPLLLDAKVTRDRGAWWLAEG